MSGHMGNIDVAQTIRCMDGATPQSAYEVWREYCRTTGRNWNKAIKTKLGILALLGALFEWICIGAAIASVLILYQAVANEAPAYYLLWSIGASVIAKCLAATFKGRKEQVDYVDQLVERGYTHAEAMSAWEISVNGGSNLLLKLQQAGTCTESNRRKV